MSHYKPYPAYKESGVEWLGRVPEHWGVRKLKWLASLQSGDFITSETIEEEGAYPVYGGNGLRGYCTAFTHDGAYALVGRQGALCGNINYADGKFWASEHAVVVSPYVPTAVRWLGELLRAMNLGQYSISSAQPGLAVERIIDLFLPVPPEGERQIIAAHVGRETGHIDALIEKKTRFIELLREKRQALITHAVTKGLDPSVKMKDSNVEWLGEVPEHWVIKRFRDICISISTGPFGTALGNEDYVTGGIPVINPSHIVDEQCSPDPDITVSADTAERLNSWAMRAGDLVTARRGELGRAALILDEQDGWICGTGSLRVRPNPSQACTGYLHIVLTSRYAREWLNLASVGATMANLNEGILGSLPLALPPSTAEQEQLLSSLATQSERLVTIEQKATLSVTLLKERRSALITAAVTGQIDLREAI